MGIRLCRSLDFVAATEVIGTKFAIYRTSSKQVTEGIGVRGDAEGAECSNDDGGTESMAHDVGLSMSRKISSDRCSVESFVFPKSQRHIAIA